MVGGPTRQVRFHMDGSKGDALGPRWMGNTFADFKHVSSNKSLYQEIETLQPNRIRWQVGGSGSFDIPFPWCWVLGSLRARWKIIVAYKRSHPRMPITVFGPLAHFQRSRGLCARNVVYLSTQRTHGRHSLGKTIYHRGLEHYAPNTLLIILTGELHHGIISKRLQCDGVFIVYLIFSFLQRQHPIIQGLL